MCREGDRPRSLLDLTDPKWKGKLATAKPQFGTAATQAACLFEVLRVDAAKVFLRGLKANDVAVIHGNKQSATGVSEGKFAIGLTDTEDAINELNARKPLAVLDPDQDGHSDHPQRALLFIPNTVTQVKGSPNPAGGKRLIDSLLLAETEVKLA